jgi:hypothetical protein
MAERGASQAPGSGPDPYRILGISPDASDEELISAYRRLVKLHHPDHNGGSVESARRFEEIQDAYARARAQRKTAPRATQAPPHAAADPDLEARMADLDREVREAHSARERARQAAREAAVEAAGEASRPSDEELGYVRTDDSFSKILADARSELGGLASQAASQAREHPITQRIADLIDDIDEFVSPSKRRPPPGSDT